MNEEIVRPFLRWAGGKRWLVPTIEKIVSGHHFNNYFEPFIGGGSIFFSLPLEGQSTLSDLNAELMNAYIQVRDYPEEIVEQLESYKNDRDFYYYMREKTLSDPLLLASRFIYLNMTSFNGIYRVNLSGRYNVPFGRKDSYNVDKDNFIKVSKKLRDTTLKSGDFELLATSIKQNDLVILDPPYTVSHNNNGFIEYNQKIFSLEDQQRLKDFVDLISAKGAYYILTNAAHEVIIDLFTTDNQVTKTVSRRSLVGGKNAKRGKTEELLFTNILD